MYIAKVISYTSEEDLYSKGCTGNISDFGNSCGYPFSGLKSFNTIEELFNYLKANMYGECFYSVRDSFENEKEVIIDIQFYTDAEGDAVYAGDSIKEAWRNGKARLWLTDVLITVKKIEELDIDIGEFIAAGLEAC